MFSKIRIQEWQDQTKCKKQAFVFRTPNTGERGGRKSFLPAPLASEPSGGWRCWVRCPRGAALCKLRNLSVLARFTARASWLLPHSSHREQQNSPLKGTQTVDYPQDRSRQHCDFLWSPQQLRWELVSRRGYVQSSG